MDGCGRVKHRKTYPNHLLCPRKGGDRNRNAVTEIPGVWVLAVLPSGLLLPVEFVCEMNLPSVLHILPLRTTHQVCWVAAGRVVAHKVPNNERHVLTVIVADELRKV